MPDGARMRGRGLRHGVPVEPPDWGLYLGANEPEGIDWPSRWLRWRDFWLPADRAEALDAFVDVHRRALAGELVEVACGGGRGRTGTALACIAQLAGVSGLDAVAWVREHYHTGAVDTPWQRRYVRGFARSVDS